MTTVLVVDDEPIVREVVVKYLHRDGFTTLEAGDGDEARRLLEQRDPSLVVLELGADDYVTKPFSPRELAARVRAVLRRTDAREDGNRDRIAFGDVTLDAKTREVTKDGRLLALTAKEFDLLSFLASHPRRVFSREQLMDRLWGYSAALDTGTVTVHVRRLREKVEDDPSRPEHLQTVWGVGYRLVP